MDRTHAHQVVLSKNHMDRYVFTNLLYLFCRLESWLEIGVVGRFEPFLAFRRYGTTQVVGNYRTQTVVL
jgi:hypothetical protein